MYMYFSITGVKKIISCIKDFVIEVCYIKVNFHCIKKAKVSSLNVSSV